MREDPVKHTVWGKIFWGQFFFKMIKIWFCIEEKLIFFFCFDMLTFHLKGWYFYFLCLIAKLLACLCLCNRINKIHGWSSNGLPQRQFLNAMSFWKPLLVLKKGQHHKIHSTHACSPSPSLFFPKPNHTESNLIASKQSRQLRLQIMPHPNTH